MTLLKQQEYADGHRNQDKTDTNHWDFPGKQKESMCGDVEQGTPKPLSAKRPGSLPREENSAT